MEHDTMSRSERIGIGAPDAKIEVTPAMIQEGVQTYYENAAGEDWESPGGDELRNLLREIYVRMARCAPKSSCQV
jgi:hypothetical protein